jgi:hypothetical protein
MESAVAISARSASSHRRCRLNLRALDELLHPAEVLSPRPPDALSFHSAAVVEWALQHCGRRELERDET